MKSRKVAWLVRKDLMQCLGNKMVLLPMIIIPLFFCAALPAAMIILGLGSGELQVNGFQQLERILYVFLNYTIMPFFLIIPLMVSVIIAAHSVALSLCSFILYFLTANSIFFAMRGLLVVRSPAWIPTLLLIDPAASLLGLGAAFLVSLKSQTYMEAQQVGALVVLPCILLIGGQLSGIIIFNPLALCVFGLALLAIDYLIIAKIGRKFDRERVIACL